MGEDFDGFIRAQWSEHNDHAPAVAKRLAESVARVQTPAQVGPYAALVVHVYGVHLAQWDDGAAVLRALRQAPGHDGSPAAEGPVARGLASLALAGGDAAAADALPPADRIAALASASSAVLERGEMDRAVALYGRALDLAETTPLADDAPAVRGLAVGANNLAAALEDRADRSATQTAAMVRAAAATVTYWQRCGGWLEAERAEYRLARSLLRAGRPNEALAAAQRCLQICERENAPAFECFFGHALEALALAGSGDAQAARAARDRALQAHAAVAADDRAWCADDLKELLAATGPVE